MNYNKKEIIVKERVEKAYLISEKCLKSRNKIVNEIIWKKVNKNKIKNKFKTNLKNHFKQT